MTKMCRFKLSISLFFQNILGLFICTSRSRCFIFFIDNLICKLRELYNFFMALVVNRKQGDTERE